MGYNSIAWLPLCAGLTVLGLVLTWVVARRRGHLSVLRGVAWSLLPIAAYLTGSVEMFWKIGAAIGHYADGFVFSPVKWAGVAVAGLAALLFFATSGRGRRRAARLARKSAHGKAEAGADKDKGALTPGTAGDLDFTRILDGVKRPVRAAQAPAGKSREPATTTTTPAVPAAKDAKDAKAKPQKAPKQARSAADDDGDMKDIEEILRKRGI
jgi:hypothetical protein